MADKGHSSFATKIQELLEIRVTVFILLLLSGENEGYNLKSDIEWY